MPAWLSRRSMLGAASALGAGATPLAMSGDAHATGPTLAHARTEDDWRAIAAQYDTPRDIVQLENGNWGVMARPVLDAYFRNQKKVNREASFYARRAYREDLNAVRQRVATALGVTPQEIAFTRGATEALQALIGGYGRLKPGDAVLLADLDYDSMQTAMRWLRTRRGVDVLEIALPEPATHQSLIDAYAAALDANPRVRLILLTHLSHRTGLVLPVREIVAMARLRGVDAIVDSAHAWGQLDFRISDLDVDFAGLNLHKWIGAPLGVGVVYVRRSRLEDIEPYMGESDEGGPHIDARVHTGTMNFAALLTVPAALDWHERIGGPAKAARLKHLRRLWVEPLRTEQGVSILTPEDPRLSAGITAFRLGEKTSAAQNRQIAETLLAQFAIFTVHRTGVAAGACVRVTPGVFNTARDMHRLVEALRTLSRR